MSKLSKYRLALSILLLFILSFGGCAIINKKLGSSYAENNGPSITEKVSNSIQFNGKKFETTSKAEPNLGLTSMLRMYLFDKQQPASPLAPIQVIPISRAQLIALQESSDVQGMVFFA